MSKKTEDYFLQSVKGVEPLKSKNKIRKKVKKIPNTHIKKEPVNKDNPPINTGTEREKPVYLVEFGKPNKKLKSGKIKFDKVIDFHGKSLTEAEEIFNNSIIENFNKQKRCMLFITGKGLNKNNYKDSYIVEKKPRLFYGKIRSAFLCWVNKPEFAKFILNFQQANAENGGDGAFVVYLRKKSNQSRL